MTLRRSSPQRKTGLYTAREVADILDLLRIERQRALTQAQACHGYRGDGQGALYWERRADLLGTAIAMIDAAR